MSYTPPLDDIRFVLDRIVDLDRIRKLPGFEHADAELVDTLLTEAGRFIAEEIAPLDRVGDQQGSVLTEDGVVTPEGFKEAYAKFAAAGWPALSYPEEYGGGGFPWVVSFAVQEMLTSANMAFSLCPMLTYSANEMLLSHGTEAQRAEYLEKLVTGEWTGTMVLTEPHAGSDVGALTTRAEPADDGSWRIFGTKIFITWGDHDVADNIIHIVLARAPGAPPGTKGISTFIVPKFLPDDDGNLTIRNDITTVSLEHKLGIHASPTCVLSFGENEGAVGYLIGEIHQGMRAMFTMMNNARLQVGLEGLAIGERAHQASLQYSSERLQGRAPGAPKGEASPIADHPDVRRMLALQRSAVFAMRGLAYEAAAAVDEAGHSQDAGAADAAGDLAAILTPVVKAWCTDLGVEVASLNIQIHGGMGFIEESGAPQHLRDARIAPIYEGTNGIQAIDLVARKLPMRGGDAVRDLLARMRREASSAPDPIDEMVTQGIDHLSRAVEFLLGADHETRLAVATPFLELFGVAAGGWIMARRAAADPGQIGIADFYCRHRLVAAGGLAETVLEGADAVGAVPLPSHP